MRKITPAILLISATAAGCGSVAAPPLSAMQACADLARALWAGAACDTMLGPACKPPGRCVTATNSTAGTCMTPDPNGCG